MIKFRILIVLFIFSCGTKKVIINSPTENDNIQRVDKKVNSKPSNVNINSSPVINNVNDYIDYFSGVAMDEMRTYKIPASITLAQGILESGSGKGRLSVEANNHFGIKCHDWKGPKIFHDDDEAQECEMCTKCSLFVSSSTIKPKENYKLFIFDEIVLNKKNRKNRSLRANTLKHEVIKGDTLYSISKKYNISIKELLKINKLKDRTLIIGQLLIIDK